MGAVCTLSLMMAMSDKFVRGCIEYAEERGDAEAVELGRILLCMSRPSG